MDRIYIPAKVDLLEEVLRFADDFLEKIDCPRKEQMQIRLAVEETFVNVASYAYTPLEGSVEIEMDVKDAPRRVMITIADSGRPFDPVAKEDADTSEEALMAREGGLGILLVKSMMDEVRYAFENGKNRLTMVKKL